jgi:hypothetical protein
MLKRPYTGIADFYGPARDADREADRNHNRHLGMWPELRAGKSALCSKRNPKKRALPGSGFWISHIHPYGCESLNEK